MKPARKKTLVVHLGNLGSSGGVQGERTLRDAVLHPNIRFLGVDIQPFKGRRDWKPRNWTQAKGDSLAWLNKLKPNSVDRINSDLSVGYYGPPKENTESGEGALAHTQKILRAAYSKLKPRAQVILIVDTRALRQILKIVPQTGFDPAKVNWKELTPLERDRQYAKSEWIRKIKQKIRLYHLILQK